MGKAGNKDSLHGSPEDIMPGIVGIVDTQSKIDIHSLLKLMCNQVRHQDWYLENQYISPPLAIARVHLGILNSEPQPIFNEDKSLCIMMEGEIYDYQDLKKDLISKGYEFSINNDPELVLRLYQHYGEDFVHKLNGEFILAIWDSKWQKLLIANDRYGARPFYYVEHNGRLLFASEVKAILEDRTFNKVVNNLAISDFISLGYILGDKTYFEGINLLPPASILVYDRDGLSIKAYWDINYAEDYESYSEESYVEELSNLLWQALERCMQGNHEIGTTLSGGLDTRTIVAYIDKKHYPLHTFTYGPAGCSDAKLAEMVADCLGTTHHFFDLKPSYLIDHIRRAVWLTDGMLNYIHSRGVAVSKDIAQHNVDICLFGRQSLDDPMSIRSVKKDLPANATEDMFLPYSWDAISPKLREELFTDSYYSIIRDCISISISQIQRNPSIRLASNKLHYHYMKQMWPRFLFQDVITFRSTVEIRRPFLDNDLVDFILTIPPKLRRDKYLLIRVFVRFFPDLARIPYQRTGLPLTAGRLRSKVHHSLGKGLKPVKRRFFREMRRISGKDLAPKRKYGWGWDEWFTNDKELQGFTRDTLLSERARSRGYLNMSAVENILLSQEKGLAANAQLIGRLLTFELWNRMFMDRENLL